MNNKSRLDDFVGLTVEMIKAYSDDPPLIFTDVNVKINENSFFYLNDLLENFEKKSAFNYNNTAISYFDPDINKYIFCGIYPFSNNVSVPIERNNLTTVKILF